mmetsp:Transcript_35527/g.92876  ORF Transcript_35527/g.92876 Transcript_35527/m.92876 type:complete len:327 (-) Transcript_35527:260-1240(-)
MLAVPQLPVLVDLQLRHLNDPLLVDGPVRGHSQRNGQSTIERIYLRRLPVPCSKHKRLELIVRRSAMRSDLHQSLINLNVGGLRHHRGWWLIVRFRASTTRAGIDPPDHKIRNVHIDRLGPVSRGAGLHLARVPDHADLLLVLRGFREHADVKAGPLSTFEVDDHKRIVQNVALLSIVGLVKVIDILTATAKDADWLACDNVQHEVKEVAALLHQGVPGVLLEPVPVAHLAQEREPVLADRQHLHRSDATAVHLGDQAIHRGDIPVLHAHPEHGVRVGLHEVQHLLAFLHGDAEWLLHEHALHLGSECILDDLEVGVIRGSDDNPI